MGEIPNPNIVNVEPIIERLNSFLMGSFVNSASSIFKMERRGFKLNGKGCKYRLKSHIFRLNKKTMSCSFGDRE